MSDQPIGLSLAEEVEMRAAFMIVAAHVKPCERKRLVESARNRAFVFETKDRSACPDERKVGALWAPHWRKVAELLEVAFSAVPYTAPARR